LAYLHAQTPVIIHGDIKESNIVVETGPGRSRARLLDFGLSRLLTHSVRKLGGSVRWMAPEVFAGGQHSTSPKADIFSLGRVLHLILAGRRPLVGLAEREIVDMAERGTFPEVEWPADLGCDSMRMLSEACMLRDPQARPWISQVQRQVREAMPTASDDQGRFEFAEGVHEIRSGGERSARAARRASAQEEVARLLHPEFFETPWQSRVFSLELMLNSWNIHVHPKSCCKWHAALAALESDHRSLAAGPCKSYVDVLAQCPHCHLMVSDDGCLRCGAVSRASAACEFFAEASEEVAALAARRMDRLQL